MIVEKIIHPAWKELEQKLEKPQSHFFGMGKYQYIYSSETKGKPKVSCVELVNYFGDDKTLWEIYSPKLIDDIERFDTREQAETRIRELLGEKDMKITISDDEISSCISWKTEVERKKLQEENK